MLLDAGVDCEAVASGLDESTFSAERPEDLALLLAKEKAKLVLVEHPDALVIGADQVAFNEAVVVTTFGKAGDNAAADARKGARDQRAL